MIEESTLRVGDKVMQQTLEELTDYERSVEQ